MALDALLARLEGRAVTPVTAGAIADVTPKPAPMLVCTPVTPVTAENDDTAGKATSEPLPDPAMEARRQPVLDLLAVPLDQRPMVTPRASTIAPEQHGKLGARVVTPEAELTALVNLIADHHGFTKEQRQEALEIALADQQAALECFRLLAARIGRDAP